MIVDKQSELHSDDSRKAQADLQVERGETGVGKKATSKGSAQATECKDRAREIGGPAGPEPTRYGDWERNGRCSDF